MLLAVTIFLVAVIFPAWNWRSQVVLATPVAESESERLRVVNSSSRWESARSTNHGSILPGVEKKMSEEVTTRRVNPNDVRSLAAGRARARARVSQRSARMKQWFMGAGIAVLITLIAWIFAVTTSFPTAIAIVFTVLTIAGGVFVGMVYNSASLATKRDHEMIAKIDARLSKLTERARVQERPSGVSEASRKKAPRQVVQARKASAISAASADAASAPSAPEAAPVAETKVDKPRVAPAPTYTPKPVYSRPNIKPFVPEEAPTAAVPYRPKAMGERFEGAVSAQSADAAPTIGLISFDDVIEARKRA